MIGSYFFTCALFVPIVRIKKFNNLKCDISVYLYLDVQTITFDAIFPYSLKGTDKIRF